MWIIVNFFDGGFHRKVYMRLTLLVALVGPLSGFVRPQSSASKTDSQAVVFRTALAAVEAADYPKAKVVLAGILHTNPESADAHSLLGIIGDRQNDLVAAEKHFAAAVRLLPRLPETHNNYGAILLRLGRVAEASREFRYSLTLNPDQPTAQINLAQIYASKGTRDSLLSARDLFKKALARSPKDIDIARGLVMIYLRVADFEGAKRSFLAYQGIATDLAVPSVSRVEFAKALLSGGLLEEAKSEIAKVLALDPSNIEALVIISDVYLAQGNIKEAGRRLETAVTRGVDNANVYAALSRVYSAGGYIENAIPALRRAIEKEPSNENFRARYGLLLIDSKAPAAAIIRLKESLELLPRSAKLWLALGIAQLRDGKSADAKLSFEKSLSLDPGSMPALVYLGTVYIDQSDYAKGVEYYQRALKIDEKNAYIHYLLADTLAKIPAADQVLIQRHLERTNQLDPALAYAHLALGKLYARQEAWPAALAEFELAAKYDHELAEAYYQLGRTLVRLKRAEEAQAAFARHKTLSETQSSNEEEKRRDYIKRLANVAF
jgi:tetratricopeptide (TPR) repeat protein